MEGDGDALMAAAYEHGLEGIIAKHRDRSYRSGRTGDWLKIKCVQSESFFIVGYEPSAAALGGIGSLLLGARQGFETVYVGSVGTGFNERQAMELGKTLDLLKTKKPPTLYDERRKNIIWAQPTLIAEVEFRGWTEDRKLRHPSYKGLREVQDNASVFAIGEPR